jgi:16S rRNA (uracil1498-N3)-methyltransferase
MAPHPDYPRTRLYTEHPLAAGACVTLDEKRAHYLCHVLRFKEGDIVTLFNGSDGEWQATIDSVAKKSAALVVQKQLRPQQSASDLWLLAAPLKNSKTEWVVEKATELGISRFCPISTQFTMVDRINETRLENITIESAEQCERMDVPVIEPLTSLIQLLGNWPAGRTLIYGDESGSSKNAKDLLPILKQDKMAVLIGPEGGFSATELELLRSLPYVTGMCMGPRIMRADTAAIALLTLVQAAGDDWNNKPAFRNI